MPADVRPGVHKAQTAKIASIRRRTSVPASNRQLRSRSRVPEGRQHEAVTVNQATNLEQASAPQPLQANLGNRTHTRTASEPIAAPQGTASAELFVSIQNAFSQTLRTSLDPPPPPPPTPQGSTSTSTSTMSQNPAPAVAATVLVPLPIPGSKKAPTFKGKNVRQFLENIELLGQSAGYTDPQLPPLIKRYSSGEVRKTISAETVFSGQDWDAAKERLLFFYGSRDAEKKSTAEKLRTFVKKSQRKKLRSRKALDRYFCEFTMKSGTLVNDGLITPNERNFLFYRGLHKKMREAIKPSLATTMARQNQVLKSSSAATIDETMTAARLTFDPEDIDYDNDGESDSDDSSDADSSDSSRSDDSDCESDDDSGRSAGKRHKGKGSRKSRNRSRSKERGSKGRKSRGRSKDVKREPVEDNQVLTDLMDTVKQLKIAVQSTINQSTNSPQISASVAAANSQPGLFGVPKRVCYMCGKVEGADLDHRLGMKICPLTQDLVARGVIKFNNQTGQLVRSNGSDLPRSLGAGSSGIAALLRNEDASRARSRDLPPHQVSSSNCLNIGLYRNEEPVIGGNTYAASAESVYAFPTTRSQTKAAADIQKQVHFDDEKIPGPSTTPKPVWKNIYKAPNVQKPGDDATKFTRLRTDDKVSSAPHPVNTEEGWRGQKKQKQVDRRAWIEEVPEDTPAERYKAKSLPYRFTSTIQDQVSIDSVEKQLLNTQVTLSLREIIGVSPELQKHIQTLVKTRREFNAHAGTGEHDVKHSDANDDTIEEFRTDEPGVALLTFDENRESLHALMERYAGAVALGARKYFAMQSELVQGVFGNEKVTFLIDSASELNIISRRVWEQTKVPVDTDSSRWTLRGIGGEPVALIGCCRDAPIQLGGKNFDHHFFVSTREHGPYDGILGQPWLSWYSCDIQYNRAALTYLRAYASGDKTGPFISLEICKAKNPRNTDRLVLTGGAD